MDTLKPKEDKFIRCEESDQVDAKDCSIINAKEKNYEFDDSYSPYNGNNPYDVHTVPDLVGFLQRNESCELQARLFGVNQGKAKLFETDRKGFLKTLEENKETKFKESIDGFDSDVGQTNGGSLIGKDYTPLLGGPFTKQLYYVDYLKAAQAAFYAKNHDPVAKKIIEMTRHFTLGRGYRTDCKNSKALAAWRAFERVNKLTKMMNYLCDELSTYGEVMIRRLENGDKHFYYDVPEQEKEKILIPRIRLEDPTGCWEIITEPEDIDNVLAYTFIYPTQYQVFTVGQTPTTKFIYQQVSPESIMHYKINTMSNEKRGRSDLFPILGHLKRLRDCVSYNLTKEQKQAAWAIDTKIEGNQNDINAYINSQKALGTIPNAGSEFVHSAKVTREMLEPKGSGMSSRSGSFQVIMDLIAMGSQYPMSYFGVAASSGSNRAGALVATEPVAKFIEDRQATIEGILQDIARWYFDLLGFPEVELEVTFPEIVSQDSSAKIKDAALAATEKCISKKRQAELTAKELDISDYDFEQEKEQMVLEQNDPLLQVAPASLTPISDPMASSGITKDDKKGIMNDQYTAS